MDPAEVKKKLDTVLNYCNRMYHGSDEEYQRRLMKIIVSTKDAIALIDEMEAKIAKRKKEIRQKDTELNRMGIQSKITGCKDCEYSSECSLDGMVTCIKPFCEQEYVCEDWFCADWMRKKNG